MKLDKQVLPLICLFLCLSGGVLYAQAPATLILTDEQGRYPVGLHMEILKDPDGQLTFAEVRSGTYDDQFIASNEEIPNLGITPSTYWFRFRVRNEATQTNEWLLEVADPNINALTLYLPQQDGQGYQIIETGRSMPFATRPIPYRNFLFNLPVNPQTEVEVYGQAISLPLSLPLFIWSTPTFMEMMQGELLQIGILAGILLIMIGYNFFLFISLRDKSYLYFVLFTFSLLFLRIIRNGLSTQYLGTDFSFFSVRAELLLFSFLFIFLLSFTETFLLLPIYAPRFARIVLFFRLSWIVTTAMLVIFTQSLPIILVYFILAIGTTVMVLVSGVVVWRRGYNAARFFLLTWFVFLFQVTLNLMMQAGLLRSEILPNRLDLAAIWIVLLLSLALADRIKLLTLDKETAQAELLQQQQEMLRLSDEYTITLQTANEQLQQMVLEREKAQQELKAYARELERSNKELQDFAYIASHDLQEPLRKIQAFGDRLKVKYKDQLDKQGIDYVNRMQSAAARMQTLIQDLLAFSRVTTRAQPYARVNLTAVIQEVLRQLEVQIDTVGAKITVDALPEIEAERSQMHQLFQNLIANSLKFHREGIAPEISITGEQLPEENRCRISVTDNGIGFSEEYKERIFVIFQRLHSRDSYQGTGVGLAVCKKIVEHHNGTIKAFSQPNQGATFVITLPLSQSFVSGKMASG